MDSLAPWQLLILGSSLVEKKQILKNFSLQNYGQKFKNKKIYFAYIITSFLPAV